MDFAKLLRAPILWNICKQLLLKTEASRITTPCQKNYSLRRAGFLITVKICAKKYEAMLILLLQMKLDNLYDNTMRPEAFQLISYFAHHIVQSI